MTDVDLDCAEARRLAPAFLAETGLVSGRDGAPRSHFYYLSDLQTRKFTDPATGKVLLEVRSTGCQTIVPPSVHPSGETIRWESDGPPLQIGGAELKRDAAELAACVLVARTWPPRGSRHDAANALAGLLLRAGWSQPRTTSFLARAGEVAGDEEWRERTKNVETTARRLEVGGEATGGPALARIMGEAVVRKLREWLDLPSGTFGTGLTRDSRPEFGQRRPLPPLLSAVPRLGVAIIPGPLQAWVVDIAERMQVPLEFVAVPALVALGATIGRQVGIYPKANDDWLVVPNLWGAVIARPGWLKSPALEEALRPLRQLARAAREEFAVQSVEAAAALEVARARKEALKIAMRQAARKDRQDELDQLKGEFAGLCEDESQAGFAERRYVTNDPTVEKLALLMKENPRGLLLERDELSGFLVSLEKAGREGDREFYLESWNGVGEYTVDRIGRGTVHVPALCLSVLGGIQPGKLSSYVRQTRADSMKDDGLLQRLQLIVYPDPPRDWNQIDRPPDLQARDLVLEVFRSLDSVQPAQVGASVSPGDRIPGVRFTAEAQELFNDWRATLEARLRSGGIESPAFESHLSKYRSLVPSLALIFHLVEAVAASEVQGVSCGSLSLAIEWAQYLEAHAARVYGGLTDRDLHAAHALARKIERAEVTDGMPVRTLRRHHWAHLADRQSVDGALAQLEDLQWLKVEDQATGGRPSEVVRLHPELVRKGRS